MLKVIKGLSDNVLYRWYDKNEELRWYTKKGILKIKDKLDKSYKWHLIKFWGIISFISIITIAFCWFCFYLYKRVPEDEYFYICGLVRLPFIIIFPCATSLLPHMDEKLLYNRKKFYKTYGEYFTES